MVYKYSPEALERFRIMGEHKTTSFQLALDECLEIIHDFPEDAGVQAKAYYHAAEMCNILSDNATAEKYCELSIKAARRSGNLRCHILSTNLLALLYLNQMNEAKATEYLYNALSLAVRNNEEDLLDVIYTILGNVFMSVEDYKNALHYFVLGIKGFVDTYAEAKTTYAGTYGSRVLLAALCYVALKMPDELEEAYQELENVNFGEVMPVYAATMTFLRGYTAYMKGEKDNAIKTLKDFVVELSETENIMDTYELLSYVYDVFMEYKLDDELVRIMELMKHYAEKIEVDKCKSQYITMSIKHCKYTKDNEGLLDAYNKYYDLQQAYNSNGILQRQTNLMLRKRLFEETEENRHKVESLQALSETDALTGLGNRYSLVKKAKELFDNALHSQQTFGVILIDIDHYKEYNDSLGHLQGDECLKEIAKVFKDVLHDFFCARYGGDEFVCVFANVSQEEIEDYCKLLRSNIEKLGLPHPKNDPYNIVTISQGISVRVPTAHDDFAVFLHEADNGLYECKENGRNTMSFFTI